MTSIQKIIEEQEKRFREEYKNFYRGILSDEVLEKGNPWFESFLRSSQLTLIQKVVEECESMKKVPTSRFASMDKNYNLALQKVVEYLKEIR